MSAPPTDAAPGAVRPFVVTHRLVLGIALPMILAYLSTPLVGITDIVVVGRLGDPALLGGVAVASVLFDVVAAAFGFLRIGTGGLAAQAFGAGDRSEEAATLLRSMIVGVPLGLLVIVALPLILAGFLPLMGGSAAVDAAARTYSLIRAWALPATFVNYVVLGFVLGLGRARLGLAFQLLLNAVNIGLSVTLTLGLGFGIAGVAWASVVAEFVTAVAGVIVTLAIVGRPLPGWRRILDRTRLRRLATVNRDIMIRSLTLMAGFSFFTAQSARSGDTLLAANAVLINVFMLGALCLDGFAASAEQIAGRAIGARFRPAFERAVRLSLLWGFGLGAAASLALYLAGDALVAAMTVSPEVNAAAMAFMPWCALTPIAAVAAFVYDGVFIGATWTRVMRDMMLLSFAVYIAAWAVLTPLFGIHGLWIALLVFLGVRGITLAAQTPRLVARTFGEGRAAPAQP